MGFLSSSSQSRWASGFSQHNQVIAVGEQLSVTGEQCRKNNVIVLREHAAYVDGAAESQLCRTWFF